jgi:hypothetical protein
MRLFLGGYPGAGKTTLARWLAQKGWHYLDLDKDSPTSQVNQLIGRTEDALEFQYPRIVAEGGFLERAPEFQELFDRVGFRPVWLTGTYKCLHASRAGRGDTLSQLRDNWVALVDQYRYNIRWAAEIDMWYPDGTRKSHAIVTDEILKSVDRRESV